MSSPHWQSAQASPDHTTAAYQHSQPYPGLEVAHPYEGGLEPARDYEGLHPVPTQDRHYPPDDHTQKQVATPVGGSLQPLPGQYYPGKPETPSAAPSYPGTPAGASHASAIEPQQGGGKTTILGLRRRTFWIVLAVVLVVIAIVAGVVGGVLGSQSGEGSPPPETSPTTTGTPTAPAPASVHEQSKLAASNWTDSSSVDHRLVYFQDQYGHLVARHWSSSSSSSSSSWSSVNISASLSSSADADAPQPPLPAEGSSLTSAATDYLNAVTGHVFYQGDDSRIYRVGTTDPDATAGSWAAGDFFPSSSSSGSNPEDAYPQAAYRSQMGATFQGCGGGLECPGNFVLAYVDADNGISMLNSSGGGIGGDDGGEWDDARMNLADEVALNTPVAMVPLRFGRSESVNYLYQLPTNELNHVGCTPDGEWHSRSDLMTLSSPSSSGIVSQLAGIKWEGGNVEMILALESDGTVKGFWWTGELGDWNDRGDSQEEFDPVTFDGYDEDPEPRWTAIATTGDGWFYGLTQDGKILEFENRQEAGDRGLFRFTSVVF